MQNRTILDLIGNTPIVKISKLSHGLPANVYAKLEFFNPCHSIKDRIGLAMITDAEKKNKINKNTVLIEPTSGNTGIGLAMVCAVKGYKLILTMPESMSVERRKLLKHFGAEIVLTPAADGMKGAVNKANELLAANQNYYMLSQFENEANPEIHRVTTASEIWYEMNGCIDALVCGVGTGGTITGVGEVLKEYNSNIKIFAVEPFDSPVLSGGTAGAHKIQGIGAGFVPKVLNTKIYEEVIKITNENAIITARLLAKEEGLLVGISSGASMCAALEVARRSEFKSKNILAILPDTGERYISTPLFE